MKHLALLCCIGSTILAKAQEDAPLIDLTMSDNGRGQVEFRIRAEGHFEGIMSALTFTVRWPVSAGVALDTAVRCYPFQDIVPMTAVAPAIDGDWMYRTFNGFSLASLSENGLAWDPGHEYPICTADILVPGTGVELIQNDWTAAHNRQFYAALGGWDRTGVFFPSPEPDVAVSTLDLGTGNLQVLLTPESDFFGWVTQVDLTLRWPAGSGVSLGPVTQDPEVAEYLPIMKEGPEVTAGGFTYQKFHGEGVKSIANSDDAWHAGEAVQALSVPIFGNSGGISVVNDDWTTAHNGDYLIELNGTGHDGPIEGIAMGVSNTADQDIALTVLPSANGFTLVADLPDAPRTATFALHNAAGQLLWTGIREKAHGRVNVQAGTGAIDQGLYILTVRHGERTLTKRILR